MQLVGWQSRIPSTVCPLTSRLWPPQIQFLATVLIKNPQNASHLLLPSDSITSGSLLAP